MNPVTEATPVSPPTTAGSPVTARLLLLVVFGLLFGLLGARFLMGGTSDGDLPPVSLGGAAPQDRLAALRADAERNPDDVRIWQEIAQLSLGQAAATGDPSHLTQARAAIERADRLAPDDVATHVVRGNLQLVLHEFGDAATTARTILDEQPGNVGGLAILTDAQVELGRYESAAGTLQELLDRRPSLPALARASYLRELHGDLDGAVSAMSQAVEAGAGLTSPQANALALLGDLQLRRGALDEARRAYDRALALVADFAPAVTGRARLLAREGDIEAAIADLEALTSRVPYPTALALLEELQTFHGDARAASDTAEVLRAVTTLQAESGQVVDLELATFEAAAGRAERGYTLAEDTYTARPTIFAASVLAWSLHRVGDTASAVPYAEESLELGYRDPVLNYWAARALADAGDTGRATEAITRALEHDPSGTFRYREDILELAEELAVEVPQAWRQVAS